MQEPKVFEGITERQIDKLFYFAQADPLVLQFTSDKERFGDRSLFNDWQKSKTVYTLSNDKQSFLGGIIWLEKKEIPQRSKLKPEDYPITIALRVYNPLRGKHLSLPFVTAALKDYFQKNPNINGVWLQTSYNNEALIKVFSKFNFVKVADADDKGKILMVAKKEQINVGREKFSI